LFYAIDNLLGDSNAGIYLNGIALPNSTGIGSFGSQNTYTDANIGSDLSQGTNWLYIDGVNLGGPAGLIFSADISTVAPPLLNLTASGCLGRACSQSGRCRGGAGNVSAIA
jgi:hypothetical protein